MKKAMPRQMKSDRASTIFMNSMGTAKSVLSSLFFGNMGANFAL